VNTTSEHPGWLEVSINIDPVAHEAISSFLFDLGCDGIVSESFNDTTIKAYLSFPVDLEEIRNRIDLFLDDLKEIFPGTASLSLRISRIENQDWDIGWRRFFKPDQVTQNLMIIPAWEPAMDSLTGHVIRIDPGPAFGTGKHPSTRMCVKAMEEAGFAGPWNMLDIGTGSGILAIYGAKLGAESITATDIDPEALRWAKRNIELNDLPIEIDLSSKVNSEPEGNFSLITANLILGTILDLSSHFQRLLAPGGRLILSGILREQEKDVEESLRKNGLVVHKSLYQEEWVCLICTRRSAISFHDRRMKQWYMV
jgi:ribosomal protein L11 methyltransferase